MFKVQGLPIIKVKLQYSKFKVKVPTYIRATHYIRRIDYQRLTPRVSISAISPCNMADFTAQYGPFYRAISAILRINMAGSVVLFKP